VRIRTIKPEFWSSAKMARVTREARLAFIGLWNEADDEGRLLGSPKRLAGSLFEHDADVDAAVMGGWLGQLESAGMIVRYEVKGTAYISIPGFGEHQRIDKRWASRLPSPPDGLAQPSASLAQPSEILAECCAPDMNSSGNVFLPEMTLSGGGETAEPPAPLRSAQVPGSVPPAEPPPPPGAQERAEARRSSAVVAAAHREHRARRGASEAIWGRPTDVIELLELPVVVSPHGQLVAAPPDPPPGATPAPKRLADELAQRFPQLDGRGSPRRRTIAEVAAVLWTYAASKPWGSDGAPYLAWWVQRVGEDAAKVARAWDADGGATQADPERSRAKREWLRRDGPHKLPPFETWFAEGWPRVKAGDDDAVAPREREPPPEHVRFPGPPSGGVRTSGGPRPPPPEPVYEPASAGSGPALLHAALAAPRKKPSTETPHADR
jgi:hypothetical protein